METQTNESVQTEELRKVKIFSLIFCGFAVLFILFALFLPIFERKINFLEMSPEELLALLETGNIDKSFSLFDELCLNFKMFVDEPAITMSFIVGSIMCGIVVIPFLIGILEVLFCKDFKNSEKKATEKYTTQKEKLKLSDFPINVRILRIRNLLITMAGLVAFTCLILTTFIESDCSSSYFASFDGANVGLVILLFATFAGVITFSVLVNVAYKKFTAEILKGLEEEKSKEENKIV